MGKNFFYFIILGFLLLLPFYKETDKKKIFHSDSPVLLHNSYLIGLIWDILSLISPIFLFMVKSIDYERFWEKKLCRSPQIIFFGTTVQNISHSDGIRSEKWVIKKLSDV